MGRAKSSVAWWFVCVLVSCGSPTERPPAAPMPPPTETAQRPYPPTPTGTAADTYHGVTVEDPYRWLEDWSDPKVKAWSQQQNAYARSVLDRLPRADEVRARLTELLGDKSKRYFSFTQRGGKLFVMTEQPPKQQPFLITLRWRTSEAAGSSATLGTRRATSRTSRTSSMTSSACSTT